MPVNVPGHSEVLLNLLRGIAEEVAELDRAAAALGEKLDGVAKAPGVVASDDALLERPLRRAELALLVGIE